MSPVRYLRRGANRGSGPRHLHSLSASEPPQELACPVVLRIGQNLLGRAGFDDPAAVEEADRGGHIAGECHLMGGHHDGAPRSRQLAHEC